MTLEVLSADVPRAGEITALLGDWRQGDRWALGRLMPLVYGELKRLAGGHLRGERTDHTLEPTALVHETYLRMVDKDRPRWRDRRHFYAVASKLMRRILVDHARARAAAKRGGGVQNLPLDEAAVPAPEPAADLLALDEALSALARFDRRKSAIVELRYFGGLSVRETAELLGLSAPTIILETRTARAWLLREIRRERPSAP